MSFKIRQKRVWIIILFVLLLIILFFWQPWKYTYSTSDLNPDSIVSAIEMENISYILLF